MPSLLCVISCSLQAQQAAISRVILHNGDQLTGQVITQNASSITIKPTYSTAITIKSADIKQIQTVNALPATQNNLVSASQKPESKPDWSWDFDVSASNRHGKQNASLLNLVSTVEYFQADWRTSLDLHYDYEVKEQAQKTHQYKVSPGVDYYLQPRLFWRFTTDYHYNYLAADYKNVDISTGPGYGLLQSEQMQLDLTLMAGLKRAYFRDTDPLRNLLVSTSLSYHFSALEWDFQYKFVGWPLEFYSEGNFMKLLNQPVQYLRFNHELISTAGLRYRLSDQIRLSWSYEYSLTDLEVYLPRQPTISFDIKDLRQKLSIGASF